MQLVLHLPERIRQVEVEVGLLEEWVDGVEAEQHSLKVAV